MQPALAGRRCLDEFHLLEWDEVGQLAGGFEILLSGHGPETTALAECPQTGS